MKKDLVAVLGVFFILAFLRPAFAAEKIGYVDIGRIFDEYEKTKEYDKALEAKANNFKKDEEAKVSEIKQLEDKLKLLSDKEKEKKQKELEEKTKGSREALVLKATALQKERNEKAKEILNDIDKAVNDYAQREGYSMIFDARSLVYNNKANDLTEAILKALQSGYKKPSAAK